MESMTSFTALGMAPAAAASFSPGQTAQGQPQNASAGNLI
jgi:hypothetical protein